MWLKQPLPKVLGSSTSVWRFETRRNPGIDANGRLEVSNLVNLVTLECQNLASHTPILKSLPSALVKPLAHASSLPPMERQSTTQYGVRGIIQPFASRAPVKAARIATMANYSNIDLVCRPPKRNLSGASIRLTASYLVCYPWSGRLSLANLGPDAFQCAAYGMLQSRRQISVLEDVIHGLTRRV